MTWKSLVVKKGKEKEEGMAVGNDFCKRYWIKKGNIIITSRSFSSYFILEFAAAALQICWEESSEGI